MQENSTSAIPYGYWRVGAEERSRMEERKERREYQHTRSSTHYTKVRCVLVQVI